MSKSGQAFIAATQGSNRTMYAVMKRLGIPLSKEQEQFQAYLERAYPEVVDELEYWTNIRNSAQQRLEECLNYPRQK